MPRIIFRRGTESKLPKFWPGEPGFTTDSNKLFVGSEDGNVEIARKDHVDDVQTDLQGQIDSHTNDISTTNTRIDNLKLVDANAEVLAARGTFPLLGNRVDDIATSLADMTYKQVFLTKQGLQGDGVFRTIASVFPSVTLAQVQALNTSATLSNSADWYILQNLANTSVDETEIVVDGSFILDLPVKIARNNITIRGKNRNSNTKFNSTQKDYWVLKGIGINQNIFTIVAGTDTHNITFKDLFIWGSQNDNGTKSGHGIEITTNVTGGQLGHLTIDHCLIHTMGGSGVIKTSGHLIYVNIRDSDIGYCYDNGISFTHADDSQVNAIEISNTYTVANGYVYNGTKFVSSTTALTNRGHGISISGVGVSIKGGDSTSNSGAGIHINSGYCNGIVVNGRYFESNELADIYVTAAYKNNLNLDGNYLSSQYASKGMLYYEVNDSSYVEIPNEKIPFIKYTHTANKEVTVSAVDVTTNTFTSTSHGLSNGDMIYPILNIDALNVYLIDKLPGGMTGRNWPGYYVINATTDTFQISSSSGGAVLDITANANMDLTKWHFERGGADPIFNSLPKMKKCKIVFKGRTIQKDAQCYVSPNSQTNNYLSSVSNSLTYDQLNINGDVYSYAEILIDFQSYLIKKVKGWKISSSTNSANSTAAIDSLFINPVNKSNFITSLVFASWAIGNGSTIEVYKLD